MGRISLTVALFASLAAAPAQAQSEEQTTAAARALFQEGMAAVDAQDFETAVDRLRRSVTLRESQVVRFNLALALLETGGYLEATEHLRLVIRREEGGGELATAATERLRHAEGQLGRLRVMIDGSRDGVVTEVDGNVMPEALVGVEQPADPGIHRVAVLRLDRELATAEAAVSTGQTTEIRLVAPPPSDEELSLMADGHAPFVGGDDDGGGIESQWWFWTLLGAVVVGGVTAAILATVLSGPAAPTLRGDDRLIHSTLLEF